MAPTDEFIERSHKLGRLIRTAREVFVRSVEECAAVVGVSPETFLAYEAGEKSPSLPEIELLAYFLGLPLEYFWELVPLRRLELSGGQSDPKVMIGLRQRIIGATLRKDRMERNLDLNSLAQRTGIPAETLQDYELGRQAVPLPHLDLLAATLGRPLRTFEIQHGALGAWLLQQRALSGFGDLPPALQEFVSRPVNRPYLELAKRLSEMETQKLRSVAEGLLEITL